jgi:hypothetical protein
MASLPRKRMDTIREEVSDRCAEILLGYRRNCAVATQPSQLILPEGFKALPCYSLGLLKTKPLKGRTVSSDVRNYHRHRLLGMGCQDTMHHVYPRVLALHDLDDRIALPDPDRGGKIMYPTHMRASYGWMEGHGIYLVGAPGCYLHEESAKLIRRHYLRQRGDGDILGGVECEPSADPGPVWCRRRRRTGSTSGNSAHRASLRLVSTNADQLLLLSGTATCASHKVLGSNSQYLGRASGTQRWQEREAASSSAEHRWHGDRSGGHAGRGREQRSDELHRLWVFASLSTSRN